MSGRRAIVGAVLVIGALIAVLVWKSRGGDRPAPREAQAVPPAATATTPVTAPSAPVAPPVTADVDDTGQARPQPVPLPPGANPPPLDGKRSDPAPPQKPFMSGEVIAKREAGLKMLEQTKTRLEADLATAKSAHDATAVHDLEIRIARTADLIKKRTGELDQLRSGARVAP